MNWSGQWFWPFFAVLIVAPFAITLVLRWLVVPIRLHATHRNDARADFRPTQADELTPEMRDYLQVVLRQFAAEGFEVGANVSRPADAAGGIQAMTVLLVNRATGDIGTIVGVISRHTRSLMFVARSDFADGKTVVTASARSIGVFPRNPAVDSVAFGWVADVATLLEAHRRRLARLGKAGLPRVTPPPGGEVDYLEAEWEREVARVAALGDYAFEPATGKYRYTWKGAFFHAWKMTEPVKSWRLRLRERKARLEWHRLGMHDWRPPAARPAGAPAGPVPTPSLATTQFARPAENDADELRYEVALPEGEIRQDWSGGVLTVRAGTPTAGRFLSRQWRSLLWLVFLGGAILFWSRIFVVSFLLTRQMQARGLKPTFLPPQTLRTYLPLGLTAFFFLAELYKLVRGLAITARGAVTLSASPAGLTYHNAPAWRGSGQVARGDVDALLVALHSVGLRGKRFRLDARVLSPRRTIPLLVAKDADALQRIADAMGQAMGIHAAAPPVPSAAPV